MGSPCPISPPTPRGTPPRSRGAARGRVRRGRRPVGPPRGAGLGAALVDGPWGAGRAGAARPASRGDKTPPDAVLLNSNENPYGPAASALAAMTEAERVAS